ncbi:MAG: 16S rRNA (guanine(527)-N(7))-methyltransferase RsmG [Elusimicrobiota bacterium]|jgi:16S rRNA (guanine527-N7)-methyltransferase|nr:16S rRNA (guanine(527)-N(7))-methyltransferase RsmG [Elusimicrobiota bacterium]
MQNALLLEFQNFVSSNLISDFSCGQVNKFVRYFDLLVEWNQKFNLISFKSESGIVYRHFCDSLYAAKTIKELSQNTELKIADLGTGSGMPGIPVKIACPQTKMTLVESVTKKCKFLEVVNDELKLNLEILNDRAENIGQNKQYRQKYDFVLSRAVSKLSPNLEIAIPLLKVGGFFIVHKTQESAQSPLEGIPSIANALNHLGAKLEKTIPYNLPNQSLNYCLLIFKKRKESAQQFPRKSGIPEKKPL